MDLKHLTNLKWEVSSTGNSNVLNSGIIFKVGSKIYLIITTSKCTMRYVLFFM